MNETGHPEWGQAIPLRVAAPAHGQREGRGWVTPACGFQQLPWPDLDRMLAFLGPGVRTHPLRAACDSPARPSLSPRGTREHHCLHAAPWAQIRILSGQAGTSWAPDSRLLRVPSRSPPYPGPPFPLTLPPVPGCGHEQADQRCLKLWALLSLQLGPSVLQQPSGWDGAQGRITANPALHLGVLTPRGGRSPCPTSTSPTDLSQECGDSSRGWQVPQDPAPPRASPPPAGPSKEEHGSLSALPW